MALTFAGLLYVQVMYMEEMIKMREQHFTEGAKRSLYALATALEQNETKKYLEEDMMLMEPDIFDTPPSPLHGLESYNLNELRNNSGITKDKFSSYQKALKEQYLYQKGLLNEVILSILNQSSDRPITERADSATVKSYLKIELENNGIVLPFEYAIIDRNGNIVYKSDKYDESTDKNAILTQALFSNDPDSRRHYLNVYFPDKDKSRKNTGLAVS